LINSTATKLAAALVVGLFSSQIANAQTPVKPIRLIVPYAAGGPIDVTARALAERVKDSLGTVIIENRPGAGGNIGADAVAKATPDGSVIGIAATATHAVNPWLYSRMPYNAATDFAPITQMLRVPNVLVMNTDTAKRLHIATLQDFLRYARANPGKLNIATINIGSTQNLAAELLRTQANLIAQIVPYNGTPAVLNALRGGQVDMAVEILGPLKPQINAKAIRLLGVMGDQRPKDMPQVPTLRELPGLSSFNVSSWNALAAPGKTPKAIVDRLSAEVAKVIAQPEMVQRLAGFNVRAQSSTPAQLAQLLDRDIVRWTEVIQRAGIAQQ